MKGFSAIIFMTVTLSLFTQAYATPNTPTGSLPPHSMICAAKKVHKTYLIGYILTKINNSKNQNDQVLVAANAELQARLFTDDPHTFCSIATKFRCSAGQGAKQCHAAIASCRAYKHDAVFYADNLFEDLNKESTRPNPAYIESASLRKLQPHQQVKKYFNYKALDDNDNTIFCTTTHTKPASPTVQSHGSPLANVRLRGKSDDLYIGRKQSAFGQTTAAALNWNGSDRDNYTAKIVAALGYAFDVGIDGQLIPYVSFNQSLTDASNRPRDIAPTNNVAVGFLGTTFSTDPFNVHIQDVFTAKPQYLFNTADRSEIASVRLIYAPWTTFPNALLNVNTFKELPFLPGAPFASLIFDVRDDAGAYTKRGDTAAIAASNEDFDRIGTRVGLALTTAPSFPSLTFMATETYLYGLAGYYRTINLFEASVTYNLESKHYFGITASYKHGRDEDTAVASQTWDIGLTVRY